jgi:hypothetical protein
MPMFLAGMELAVASEFGLRLTKWHIGAASRGSEPVRDCFKVRGVENVSGAQKL